MFADIHSQYLARKTVEAQIDNMRQPMNDVCSVQTPEKKNKPNLIRSVLQNLSTYFKRVTIIERDLVHDKPE